MERFSQGGNVLLGFNAPYGHFDAVTRAPSTGSPAATVLDSVDFADVFGGPPRRSSIQERRYSIAGGKFGPGEDRVSRRSPWAAGEKSVFGEESGFHRRLPSDDFYDDIFKGSCESRGSPRWSSNSPGSRELSPSRPSPPGADLPAPFSLPAKLNTAVDLPVFASSNRSPYRSKEATPNGYIPNITLSRFSNQAIDGQDDLKNSKSPFSDDFSFSSEDSSHLDKSTENEIGGSDLRRDSQSTEGSSNRSLLHFSIYKWASREIPSLIPLRGENSSVLRKNGTIDRCRSFKGYFETDNHVSKSSTNSREESGQNFDEEGFKKQEWKAFENVESTAGFSPGHLDSNENNGEKKIYNPHDTSLSEVVAGKFAKLAQETNKPEVLSSPVQVEFEGRGNGEVIKKADGNDNLVTGIGMSCLNIDAKSNVTKQDSEKTSTKRAEVNKVTLGSPTNSGENTGKSRVKGKVKEFVKIFNEVDPPAKPHNANSKSKMTGTTRSKGGIDVDAEGLDSKISSRNLHLGPDTLFTVEESNDMSKNKHSDQKAAAHEDNDISSGQKNTSLSFDSLPGGPQVNMDDLFQDSFQIKELSLDEDKPSETEEESDAIRAADAKIRQWSNGKNGNIRSLLSTLQYVLWQGSGWKAVPLVDIIEGSAVKRSYQKALLCLHPDKLQQKGAAAHQKYIAEKVFDILQEAWDHFNSLGSL